MPRIAFIINIICLSNWISTMLVTFQVFLFVCLFFYVDLFEGFIEYNIVSVLLVFLASRHMGSYFPDQG